MGVEGWHFSMWPAVNEIPCRRLPHPSPLPCPLPLRGLPIRQGDRHGLINLEGQVVLLAEYTELRRVLLLAPFER